MKSAKERSQIGGANYLSSLKIRQSTERGAYVQGLVEKYVYSPEDIMILIKQGEKLRSTSSTDMNERSSRSHSVLTVTVSYDFCYHITLVLGNLE